MAVILLMTSISIPFWTSEPKVDPQEKLDQMHYPSELFFMQRSWPDSTFAFDAYEKALQFYNQGLQYITINNENLPNYYLSISSIYVNIANNFQSLGQYEKTLYYLNKAKKLQHFY